jgi:hypothetical protein
MTGAVTLDDMQKVFSITDRLGIHRERVKVPLAKRGAGSVEPLAGGVFRITLPENTPLDAWLPDLDRELRARLGG